MEDGESGSAGQGQFYLLTYDHKHGMDFSLHRSETSCFRTMSHIMLDWLKDLPSIKEQRRVLDLLKAEKYGEARSLWTEHMNEYFNVEGPFEPGEVDAPDYGDVERELAEEEAALADNAG